MKQWFAKTLYTLAMKVSGPLEMRKNKVSPLINQLTSLGLEAPIKEDKPRWSPVITLGSGKKKRQKAKSRKTNTAGAHGTECQRSEGSEKTPEICKRLPRVDSAEK